jgi:hypothetical protein
VELTAKKLADCGLSLFVYNAENKKSAVNIFISSLIPILCVQICPKARFSPVSGRSSGQPHFWVRARFCAFFCLFFVFFLFVCALSSYRSTMRKVAVLSFACAFLAVLSVAFAQSAPTKFTHYVRTFAGLVTILRCASSPQSRPP